MMYWYCPKCGEEKELKIFCLYHNCEFTCPDCQIFIRLKFEIEDPEEEET